MQLLSPSYLRCATDDLTDMQWSRVEEVFRDFHYREERRGRPAQDIRAVLDGVIWKFSNDKPWRVLPLRYPNYKTCHRYFMTWRRSGLLNEVLLKLFGDAGKVSSTQADSLARVPRAAEATADSPMEYPPHTAPHHGRFQRGTHLPGMK